MTGSLLVPLVFSRPLLPLVPRSLSAEMPPKRNQKGSKQSSKAPSKAASKAPSGASTPRAVEPQTPVKLAPGLLGLNFGQSFSSVAIIDKVRQGDCPSSLNAPC